MCVFFRFWIKKLYDIVWPIFSGIDDSVVSGPVWVSTDTTPVVMDTNNQSDATAGKSRLFQKIFHKLKFDILVLEEHLMHFEIFTL